MKLIKRLTFLLSISIILSGCARSCESFKRNYQSGDRNYCIEQYSGGRIIKIYEFKGILNNSEHSDGFYFSIKDTLIEVSGDLVIKSW